MAITWFIMNPSSIILYTIIGLMLYVVVHVPELKDRVKFKTLPGLAVAISSFFSVGLYCLITVLFYYLGIFILDMWKVRMEERNIIKK